MTNISADFVIKLALILVLSILPSLVYLLIFQKAKKRWQTRLRRSQINAYHYNYRNRLHQDLYDNSESYYLQTDRRRTVTKYFIGDNTCVNNARSPYIRCAINPEGPCDDCQHYEKRQSSDR